MSRCGCPCTPTRTARCCSSSRCRRARCSSCWPGAGCGTASVASPTAPISTGRGDATRSAASPIRSTLRSLTHRTTRERAKAAGTTATPAAPAPTSATPMAGTSAPASAGSTAAPPADPPRPRAAPPRRASRTVRCRGGLAVVGHGVRDADQPHHRFHPNRAAGRHPRRGTVQRVLGRLSAAEPHRRARPRGDVHRDLRAGTGPRGARRRRRRYCVRASTGDVGHRPAAGRHRRVGNLPRRCWCASCSAATHW